MWEAFNSQPGGKTMKTTATAFALKHSRVILMALFILTLLLIGGAGEVAAHNPAGIEVTGCENGADTVAQNNPNCHG